MLLPSQSDEPYGKEYLAGARSTFSLPQVTSGERQAWGVSSEARVCA